MAEVAIGKAARLERAGERKSAAGETKRASILQAARRIFDAEGLDGASLRAIATEAGYTPAALYFHFDSKEAVYAEVLAQSLERLKAAINTAIAPHDDADGRFLAAAMGFFSFYADHPGDLDLGFYLFRGGMKPRGLGRERDEALNAALAAALRPVADAATAVGASAEAADRATVDIFAHAAGLLLLAHTGRIRMFGASAAEMMAEHAAMRLDLLKKARPT